MSQEWNANKKQQNITSNPKPELANLKPNSSY